LCARNAQPGGGREAFTSGRRDNIKPSLALKATQLDMGKETPAMHSCGHDGHTAIRMGVAEPLAGSERLDIRIVGRTSRTATRRAGRRRCTPMARAWCITSESGSRPTGRGEASTRQPRERNIQIDIHADHFANFLAFLALS
jgi:hypothetical protein